MSEKMKTLEELFVHQLQDLYSAEHQLTEAMPKMVEKASNPKLKEAFKKHLQETEDQKHRLVEVMNNLKIKIGGEKCKAIEGLIKETESFMKEKADAEVMDAGLIACAQRVEHYEISGYGTAKHFANRLGHHDASESLAKTLEEEKDCDESLNDLAIEKINAAAE